MHVEKKERARFTLSGQVTLAAGYGYVRFAPIGENWEIDSYTVGVSTQVLEAICNVYQRQLVRTNIVDTTPAGSSGAVSDTVLYHADGEALFFEWTGGDATAVATVTIRGWKTLPQRGFRAVS